MGVIILQARGARRAFRTDPDAALEALDAIETTGTTALAEMRGLVGVLRDGGQPMATRAAAQPAPRRVARCHGAGGGTPGRALAIEGTPVGLPGGHGRICLPDRAGGADQRAGTRGAARRRMSSSAMAPMTSTSRSTTPGSARATSMRRPRTDRACASGCPSTTVGWRSGHGPAAASWSTRACRCGPRARDDPGHPRRRRAARPAGFRMILGAEPDIAVVGGGGRRSRGGRAARATGPTSS